MALTLPAKPSTATIGFTWVIPLADGDSTLSAAVSVVSGTVTIPSQELAEDGLEFQISGGAAGETAVLSATATTSDGETLTETIYLPVRAGGNIAGDTARDVCAFALRKITGIGEEADAAELVMALEILNDMVAEWRLDGMDIGVPGRLSDTDTLLIDDGFLSAVKYCLTIRVAEEFDRPLTPTVVEAARAGLRRIKAALVSEDRPLTDFY